ncbi:CaiB/BaiF CoA transferase family protein [Ochrobactrum quorumnocens]|uniref:CaiB/BaiF CoA transferase family protein n=1 Tax=Ochrobactrum quorumnocens TaxID=271865 RepID=UPI001FD371D6|nr:CoA transferase [[Ochrobactrum] quorumnocens]
MAGTVRAENQMPWRQLPLIDAGVGCDFLSGCRVVDLTTSIAGPYATMLLSDFGAEVIKVERPEGDDARAWGPPFLDDQALWFTAVNRNKKSVVLDIRKEAGRADLLALIESADVVVTNQPPDIQRKFNLDYETLSKIKSNLVFVSITGFGLDGARSELTSYDLIAEGYSGIMDVTGAAGGAPQKVGAPAADMLAGQDAAMAAMAALFSRQKTGKGAKIDVSLVESMTRLLACRIISYFGSGEVPIRSGGTDSVIAIYQSFDTADEPINLGIGSNAIWTRFWAAVDDATWGSRAEFATNAARRDHRAEIVIRIQSILRTKTRQEWLDLFAGARVPAGPINRVDQTAHDGPLQDRGMFFTLKDGDRLVPQVGLGIRINDTAAVPRSAPPLLGQHTEEVLSELKHSETITKSTLDSKDDIHANHVR